MLNTELNFSPLLPDWTPPPSGAWIFRGAPLSPWTHAQTERTSTPGYPNRLRLGGKDAEDFLHRLTTLSVRNLPEKTGKRGFFLNPQGKIRSHFFLWRYSSNAFCFELDPVEGQVELLKQVIEEYTFAEKLWMRPESPTRTWDWIFPSRDALFTAMKALPTWLDPALAQRVPLAPTPELPDVGVSIASLESENSPLLTPSITWILNPAESRWGWPTLSFHLTELDGLSLPPSSAQILSPYEVESVRIAAKKPIAPYEIHSQLTPLDLQLQEGIADQKGCYPGQEVIEKIISLGSPPLQLNRFEVSWNIPFSDLTSASPIDLVDPLTDRVAGTLTSATYAETGTSSLGLGFLKKPHHSAPLESEWVIQSGQTGQKPAGRARRITREG